MDFFKRHKNKFLTFGVVSAIGGVGVYMFDKYVERRVAEQREIETQQKLRQLQRQQQFENTQNIAEKTLNSALLPALKEVINGCLSTEEVLKELRNDSTNTELWHQLKLLVFAKCSAQVFCGSLLQMLTRIQLHILAGYNVRLNNNKLPEKIQESFLQLRSQPYTLNWIKGVLSNFTK